jgi:hypothetical protein
MEVVHISREGRSQAQVQASGKIRSWVWVSAAAILVIWVGLFFINLTRHTGGEWSYPLDDTYIHLTLAKNIALHHQWGIQPESFASASSSPLYTLILGLLFMVIGIQPLLPLFLNLLAGIALLYVITRVLVKEGLIPLNQWIILGAVLVFTPLPILVISGMEHTFQCLWSFLLLFGLSSWMETYTGDFADLIMQNRRKATTGLPWPLLCYAFLLVGTRYEGLFLIAIAMLLLAGKGRWWAATQLGIAGGLPVILFGLYAWSKGSYFLPNSILLKSGTTDGLGALVQSILTDKLALSKQGITGVATQRLLFILPLCFLVFRTSRDWTWRYGYWLLLCGGTALLHLCLASTGWFYRYEGYLVLNATVITGILCIKLGPSLWAKSPLLVKGVAILLFGYLMLPLVLRSSAGITKATRACLNIYEQQQQMGKFLQQYYPHQAVAANDIGAIGYQSSAHLLDLWGLGNIDVARAKMTHRWTPDFLDSLARAKGVQVVLVYDSWFDPALLARWTKVGTWTIPDNVICGDASVSFYTPEAHNADSLRTQLRQFSSSLPNEVSTHYFP